MKKSNHEIRRKSTGRKKRKNKEREERIEREKTQMHIVFNTPLCIKFEHYKIKIYCKVK